MNRFVRSLRSIVLALAVALATSPCLGAFFTGFGRLPSPDVPYDLVNPPAAAGSVTIHSLKLQASNFADVEYPTVDHENDLWLLDSTFDVNYEMHLSLGLGPIVPRFGFGEMHVVGSAPIGPNPWTRIFQLELTQLDLIPSQLDPFPTILLRESPTLASTGVTTVVDLCLACGAFHWQVDSFFDVFTEISVSGGQDWTPTTASMRLVQLPEPTTLMLLLLGMLTASRRRCRR
jgi:hypothetical protein